MNTYEIEFKNGYTGRAIGETAGKAKYDYYLEVADCYDGFGNFLSYISSCRKLRSFHISDLFGDKEQFERMAKMRGIEFAYLGMKVSVCGQMGTIVGSNRSLNLNVVYDGQYNKDNCHPWYETVYYDRKGNVVADYREKKVANGS
jgi:hypothetical protein